MRALVLAALTVAAGSPAASVAAQDAPEAIAATQAVADRLEREWACVRDKQRELVRTVELMREARAQMARSPSGSRAHADALAAIESLRQRAVRLEREAIACRTEPSAAARADAPPEGVVVRTEQPSAAERAVAERNPATRVIERDVLLAGSVHAVVGEQVDGRGTVDAQAVRRAIRAAAPRISRCYDRMVDRGALQRGTIILAFDVEPGGRVTAIRTEQNSFRNQAFAQCVRGAARGLRVAGGASGGDATISYTLRLPAE